MSSPVSASNTRPPQSRFRDLRIQILTTRDHSRHVGQPSSTDTTIEHLNLIGDTTETLATAFALLLNGGYTAVWAQASGSQLTIYSRTMGTAGNSITIATSANDHRPYDHDLGNHHNFAELLLSRAEWMVTGTPTWRQRPV